MVTLNESIEKRISKEIAVALPSVDKKVLTSIKNLVNSGNKFRANLFCNTSRCFGYNHESNLLTILASLEILHRVSLMHDDLADKSSTRRGINTLHTSYGDTFAIYVPNLLRDHAEKMLADYPFIQKELMKVYNEICRGQLFEIQIAESHKSTWEDYERLVELKSAGLGRFALSAAYYLSHNQVDKKNPRNIAKTGALLFQIVDDLEDLLEIQSPMGAVSTDVQNGIKPAPWFFLPQKEKARLKSPRNIQRALTRPDVLNKTYMTASRCLTQLTDKLIKWLPENSHRTAIVDDINYRFSERTQQYRGGKMKTKTKETIKKVGIESLAIVTGATLGGIVRATGIPPEVLVLPPLLQLTKRFNPVYKNCQEKPFITQDIWTLAKYGLGVGLVYADKIYPVVRELLN